jgi:hypothetical protein
LGLTVGQRRDIAMKNNLQRLIVRFALGALLLAASSVVVPAAPASADAGSVFDTTDILALNPEHE